MMARGHDGWLDAAKTALARRLHTSTPRRLPLPARPGDDEAARAKTRERPLADDPSCFA